MEGRSPPTRPPSRGKTPGRSAATTAKVAHLLQPCHWALNLLLPFLAPARAVAILHAHPCCPLYPPLARSLAPNSFTPPALLQRVPATQPSLYPPCCLAPLFGAGILLHALARISCLQYSCQASQASGCDSRGERTAKGQRGACMSGVAGGSARWPSPWGGALSWYSQP